MFRKAVPILPALNITESVAFYETRLGFTARNFGNYAILHYKNTEIHLLMTNNEIINKFVGCLIMVDNVEDLYTNLIAKGLVQFNGRLSEKPWGIKEFAILDNNNNVIRFGQQRN